VARLAPPRPADGFITQVISENSAQSLACTLPSMNALRLPAFASRMLSAAALATGLLATAPAAAAVLDDAPENALLTLMRADAARYEHGDGVERDGAKAASIYCEAARMGDAESQFALGWMYANGRGVERSDATAAFFFHAAAEQGYEQAQRMLRTVGGPSTELPVCMRPVEPPAPPPPVSTSRNGQRPAPAPWPPEVARFAPTTILTLVKQLAPEYKVDPELVLSIMKVESNFNQVALSPKNAKGLMQMIPETAARFGVLNPYDPAQNIRGGMAYLRWLLAYFEGDVRLVAAAYNAGERAVERYRGVPPYLETQLYVLKVLATMSQWSVPFDATVTAPSMELRRIREMRRYR